MAVVKAFVDIFMLNLIFSACVLCGFLYLVAQQALLLILKV